MTKLSKNDQEMEKTLGSFYKTPNPSPEFLKNFEFELKNELEAKNPPLPRFLQDRPKRFAWAVMPALVLLLIIGAVFIVGPESVYAQVRSWLGYIPGIGHVNTQEGIRVLEEPLQLTKEGISVELSKIIANESHTYILIKKEGLPVFQKLFAEINPQDQALISALWQTDAQIFLPDGSCLNEIAYTGGVEEGRWEFPALPAGVNNFILEIKRLPAVPEGKAPQNWSFNVQLTQVISAEDLPEFQNHYPELPVLVVETPEAFENITDNVEIDNFTLSLSVINAVYSETETALQVQINNLPDGWQISNEFVAAELSDDLGNSYEMIQDNWNLNPDKRFDTFSLTFSPLSPQAEHLFLNIRMMAFQLYFGDQSIELDLSEPIGNDGFSPLDSTLNILSVPVHFSGVYLEEQSLNENSSEGLKVNFVIDPAPIVNGISVVNIMASPETAAAFGGELQAAGGGGGPSDPESEFTQITLSFRVSTPQGLPEGKVRIPLNTAIINYDGNLQLDWEMN